MGRSTVPLPINYSFLAASRYNDFLGRFSLYRLPWPLLVISLLRYNVITMFLVAALNFDFFESYNL